MKGSHRKLPYHKVYCKRPSRKEIPRKADLTQLCGDTFTKTLLSDFSLTSIKKIEKTLGSMGRTHDTHVTVQVK